MTLKTRLLALAKRFAIKEVVFATGELALKRFAGVSIPTPRILMLKLAVTVYARIRPAVRQALARLAAKVKIFWTHWGSHLQVLSLVMAIITIVIVEGAFLPYIMVESYTIG